MHWNLTPDNFISLNPSVGPNCVNGVKAGEDYCIEWTDDEPVVPTTSQISRSTPLSRDPVQAGLVESCGNPRESRAQAGILTRRRHQILQGGSW